MSLFDEKPSAAIKKPEVPQTATAQASIAPQMDPKQQMDTFLEGVAKYKQFGKVLRRETTLSEVGMQLAQIAEMAEQAVVAEADDWFDAHTLKRNMKEIKNYTNDFVKLAKEADMINQRMTALYEDMGRVLERYFEMPDDEIPGASASDDTVASSAPSRDQVPMKESAAIKKEDHLLPSNPSEPALPSLEDEGKTEKTDQLTLRAIQAVHERLKKTNPSAAKKFAQLPPAKMKELVWRLVK